VEKVKGRKEKILWIKKVLKRIGEGFTSRS
jgi:hypothetical protein